jgi:hypothetical protein
MTEEDHENIKVFRFFSATAAQRSTGRLTSEALRKVMILNKDVMCKAKCLVLNDVMSYVCTVRKVSFVYYI